MVYSRKNHIVFRIDNASEYYDVRIHKRGEIGGHHSPHSHGFIKYVHYIEILHKDGIFNIF